MINIYDIAMTYNLEFGDIISYDIKEVEKYWDYTLLNLTYNKEVKETI